MYFVAYLFVYMRVHLLNLIKTIKFLLNQNKGKINWEAGAPGERQNKTEDMIGVKINDVCWCPKLSMDINWQVTESQHMAAQGTHLFSRL